MTGILVPDRIERIARLVAQPSVSCTDAALDQSNRGVIDQLAGWLEPSGFEVQVLPLGEGKANLVASFGKGDGGLVLAGHTDTVPFDADLWQSDPLRLTERDGRLYGLGATDMKAFLALAVEAVEGLRPEDMKQPLLLVATADEESTMQGARSLLSAGRPLGRHAVIGEPSDMRPIRAHKGVMMESLTVLGRSGHSSDPSLGNSALDGMYRVLQALIAFRDGELAARRHADFAVATPTMNLASIRGGDNPNRICAQCRLEFDLRPLPGMDLEELRAQVARCAEDALAGTGLTLQYQALFPGVPPYELSADAAIVRATEELTEHGAVTAAFGTEAPYFAGLGLQSVILGPGSISVAHQPDEYVAVEHLGPTVNWLQRLTRQFCLSPE